MYHTNFEQNTYYYNLKLITYKTTNCKHKNLDRLKFPSSHETATNSAHTPAHVKR